MSMLRDAKGKLIPVTARYTENIAALGAHAGYKVGDLYIGFALYLPEESTVEFIPIDNTSSVTSALAAGYHPLSCKTVTFSSKAALALFAYKPAGATGEGLPALRASSPDKVSGGSLASGRRIS